MRALLHLLGEPQERFRIVHVAGSKGKGSTSALLASVLGEAGYRTGLFTSPHLCRVEERMQVAGVSITPAELTALLDDVRSVEPRLRSSGELTFFEVGTALGFLHFARRRVEVAVVEVGLGGRFDSTNVCQPAVSVITSISYDHTKLLGDQLSSIAFEKAGIVKPGRPVVSGVTVPEARQVIERVCRERRASLLQLGIDFHFAYEPGRVTAERTDWPRVTVRTPRQTWPGMTVGLLGEHQSANAAVAVACVEELRHQGMHISDRAVAEGLADVSWPARLEVVGRSPLVVLDCAHNVASAEAMVQTLRTSFSEGRRLLVFASSNDKDVAGILRVLAPHFAHAYLTRFVSSPRGVPAEQLAELLRQTGGPLATVCATPAEAWRSARAAAGAEDLICITGSVFLAGELRPLLF
jgi:dihydrofolate synthase/folylpolyglutamate synthase